MRWLGGNRLCQHDRKQFHYKCMNRVCSRPDFHSVINQSGRIKLVWVGSPATPLLLFAITLMIPVYLERSCRNPFPGAGIMAFVAGIGALIKMGLLDSNASQTYPHQSAQKYLLLVCLWYDMHTSCRCNVLQYVVILAPSSVT